VFPELKGTHDHCETKRADPGHVQKLLKS